jgi:hypothetical protein
MKASELRPGNIVDQGGFIEPVNEYQIYQFSLYQIGAREPGIYKDWKPVPITEETLDKFGITNLNSVNTPGGEYFMGLFSKEMGICGNESYNSNQIYYAKCEFVHKLQNLVFCLTDQELDTTKFLNP